MNAMDDFDDRAGPAATTGIMTLPAYPSGRRQHAHHRVDFMRTVDNLLAEKGLLALAKTGAAPARVESLIDMDMDEIPELSPDTASYESRRALRAQHKVKNAQNNKQRCRFYCEDATKIYTMLHKCAEVANKTLAAQMLRRCNMATQEEREQIPGHSFEGYWDGRMAYRLLWRETPPAAPFTGGQRPMHESGASRTASPSPSSSPPIHRGERRGLQHLFIVRLLHRLVRQPRRPSRPHR